MVLLVLNEIVESLIKENKMKTNLNIPLTVEVNHCPHCNMDFTLFCVFFNDDSEKYASYAEQIYNKGRSFYCPYCGKDFEAK